VVETVRARVTDAVAPILDAMSRPAGTIADVVEDARELARLRDENARLREQNRTLLRFEEVAYRLEAENASLRGLMNYTPERPHAFITARVIADNSGAFVRSVAINLGARNGVADGQAVMGGYGLAGRVVQAGDRSARILLLTDLNARIPVMVERTRDRAVLAGDNSMRPALLYLTVEADVAVGDRIVTSGHGGMFPPGLPVGIVANIADGDIRVQPFEDLDRLEYVRVVQFQPASVGTGMVEREPASPFRPIEPVEYINDGLTLPTATTADLAETSPPPEAADSADGAAGGQ
jgi:rod shape-determining protein MreC